MASTQTDNCLKIISNLLTFAALFLAITAMLQVKVLKDEVRVLRDDVNHCQSNNGKEVEDIQGPSEPPPEGTLIFAQEGEDKMISRTYGQRLSAMRHPKIVKEQGAESGYSLLGPDNFTDNRRSGGIEQDGKDEDNRPSLGEIGKRSRFLRAILSRRTADQEQPKHRDRRDETTVNRQRRAAKGCRCPKKQIRRLAKDLKRVKVDQKKMKAALDKLETEANNPDDLNAAKGALFVSNTGSERESGQIKGVLKVWKYAEGMDKATQDSFTLGNRDLVGKVTVKSAGYYYVFAQLTFVAKGRNMMRIQTENGHGRNNRTISVCTQTSQRVGDRSKLDSCYSGTLVYLRAEDRVYVSVFITNITGDLYLEGRSSFFGIVKL